jgi:arginyl-tRNA synthetase
LIANYVYELCKEYNRFYQEVPILKTENPVNVSFRLQLSRSVGNTVRNAMNLLGIEVPDKM